MSRVRLVPLLPLVSLVLVAGLSGCSLASSPDAGSGEASQPTTQKAFTPLPAGAQYYTPPASGADPGADQPAGSAEVVGSLRPDSATPEQRVPQIVARGRIVVGISSSLNLMAFQNPTTGQVEGFDVDIAREIARDIFGDPNRVDFRFLTTAERENALTNHDVDIVVRTLSVTQDRAQRIQFSIPYLRTKTRILSLTSNPVTSADQLRGLTVCATRDSLFHRYATQVAPQSKFLLTYDWSDCLVALQQHQVQAIISDDAILSGIAAQDPWTHIAGPELGVADFAVGIPLDSEKFPTDGLVRQVNSTLLRMQSDGSWWRSYSRWLQPYVGSGGVPPAPVFRQEGEN